MRSVLPTDGYKFSMAMAGWPLRRETFYYTHRRGGPHFVPCDLARLVRDLLPEAADGDYAYLAANGYPMDDDYAAAIRAAGDLRIDAAPAGTWLLDREPAFSVTGPSAVGSWLEPLALQIHYRIQVATIARLAPRNLPLAVGTATCEEQRRIVLETLAQVGVPAPEIEVDERGYFDAVKERAARLVDAVGDPRRLFEVGMRAATCMQEHEIALRACMAAGIRATSNVLLARKLGMTPVGTMGHEHVQRHGDDEAAFRAMRDRCPKPPAYLPDTLSTLDVGLPAAFRVMAERPGRRDAIRFDSGSREAKEVQLRTAVAQARALGLAPRYILEDGFDEELTRHFEGVRRDLGIDPADQTYAYGGYLVRAPWTAITRDRVAAVWKLTQSGGRPTMKFGDEEAAGKESVPGRPVLHRRAEIVPGEPAGLIAQEGEDVPDGWVRVTGADAPPKGQEHLLREPTPKTALSPRTAEIVAALRAERDAKIAKAKETAPCPLPT